LRLALAAALLVACAEPPRPMRPDILVISIDTVRADHTSLYGYERRTTPEVERQLEALGYRDPQPSRPKEPSDR
jgi:hypothetical protein